jgi:hypothetical protein
VGNAHFGSADLTGLVEFLPLWTVGRFEERAGGGFLGGAFGGFFGLLGAGAGGAVAVIR